MAEQAQIRGATASSRLWRLLGLGSRSEDRNPASLSSNLQAQRALLLEEISKWLLRHELAISPENLARAHAVISGSDRRLAAAVREREAAGEPISQQWLEENDPTRRRAADPAEDFHKLSQALERSLASFGETTQSASAAASSYGAELQRQVDAVEAARSTENVLASLAHVARAMLERTHALECEMRRSEEEARNLRLSLEKARREAAIDHLTGLPNRRAFEAVFREERVEARRTLEPLCLALCDIDFFKKINDTHGHDTGDRVIRAVGQALARISDRCHVARHGGEEFVLLFRGLDLAAAKDALDAARERLAARHFVDKISGKPIGGVTFSGGLVDALAHPDLGETMRAADEALYRAKRAGRNRIELATQAG